MRGRACACSLVASVALAATGCSFDKPTIPGGGADAAIDAAPRPDGDIAAFRKRIVISPQTAGVTLTGDLRDIPIAVILDRDADLAAKARTDAADIVFTAGDGTTLLSHEIEQFDAAAGVLVAWVKLPVLDQSVDSSIFMYYGSPDASERQDVAGTWSNGYAGVWHLVARDIGGGVNEYRDSSPNQNHGTALGNSRPGQVEGIVGPGQNYDGTSGNPDIIEIPDPADGGLDFGTSSFSWSAWVHVTQSAGEFDLPFFKGASVITQPGYNFELGTGTWEARVSDGTTLSFNVLGDEVDLRNGDVFMTGVVDRQGNQFRSYINASLVLPVNDITGRGSVDNTLDARLGGISFPFKGLLDEVRVYSVALSDDRVAIEHANIANTASFLSVGQEEATAYP